jgi:hypothetical protein
MSMNRKRLAFAAAGAAVSMMTWAASLASSAEAVGRYEKPVELPEFDQEELVVVALDSDVYDATSDQFSDIRLLNAGGGETAFIIRKPSGGAPRCRIPRSGRRMTEAWRSRSR